MFLHTEQHEILKTLLGCLPPSCNEAYIVGGCIRDTLAGITPRDLDIVTKQDPAILGKQLSDAIGGNSYRLSAEHDIVRVDKTSNDSTIFSIDLSSMPDTIAEDLLNRDFTINSMALPLAYMNEDNWTTNIIDPFRGMQDLQNRVVKATNINIFSQDGLRLLRGVRIASKLNLRLDPSTAKLMKSDADFIQQVAPERIRDEILTIFSLDSTSSQLDILDRLGILCRIIPELSLTKGVDQPKVHYWDVWGHSIHAVQTAEMVTSGHHNSAIYSLVPWTTEIESHFGEVISDGHNRRTLLKLTALLHDIAKPQTKSTDSTGRTRFLGHSEEGSRLASNRLSFLRFSNKGIKLISKMIYQHLRPANMSYNLDVPTNRAIYRYYRDLEDAAIDTLYLAMADYLAAKGPEIVPDDWARHARMVSHILQTGSKQQNLEQPNRLLTGSDLIEEFKLIPGPQIGEILEYISESRAAGEIATKEDALALVAQYLSNTKSQG